VTVTSRSAPNRTACFSAWTPSSTTLVGSRRPSRSARTAASAAASGASVRRTGGPGGPAGSYAPGMPALLVLAFVLVPLIELVVILQVGQVIGTGWTVALLVIDSLVGAWLLKRESVRAWHDFRAALSAGRWPGDEVTQGGLVIVGGTLLLTPGFVTDVVGLLALLPPSRAVASQAHPPSPRPRRRARWYRRGRVRGRRASGDRSGSEPRSRGRQRRRRARRRGARGRT
jgi:UPF0716 family protein affecting phage T7 exclusion